MRMHLASSMRESKYIVHHSNTTYVESSDLLNLWFHTEQRTSIAEKFGGELDLAVWQLAPTTARLKSTNTHMAIPYRTTKYKSANIFCSTL